MALLTNTDLSKITTDNIEDYSETTLIISPLDKDKLTPVGYDLRVGGKYFIEGEEKSLTSGNKLTIDSKKMALICTLEEIRMPKDKTLSAIIHSKVSLSCKGLSNISTTVDADWKGKLLIAIHNNSTKSVSLE